MDVALTVPVRMTTPLGDALTLHSMDGAEEMSEPFVYELEIFSTRSNIQSTQLLNQSVTVHLELGDGDSHVRHWNGRVSEFRYIDTNDDGLSRYRLTLRPWLWQLTLSANCRVFQHMTVPQIVSRIFHDRGFDGEFENALTQQYPVREYVVQYRESDLEFVSRWLEREGIGYYFRHQDGKHVLVLVDASTAHTAAPGYASIPYAPEDAHRDETVQYVWRWHHDVRMETGSYAHADYDFTKPRCPLYANRTSNDPDAESTLRIYDYPGHFASFTDGASGAQLRLEQARRDTVRFSGETNARGLTVGSVFQVTGHPREEENRKVLVVSARSRLRAQRVQSGGVSEEPFECSFAAIDSSVTFRPPLPSRKPWVRGPQSATVVGPPDKEIWTDRYGRIMVKFNWERHDREEDSAARSDQNSSCWVRVAQSWAGTGWGAQFIPRIGQEVLVEFLDGDPDRPIVTGSVYNDSNMPPFDLPLNATQSGIRTQSTPGGSMLNYNEVRFEDRLGAEELRIQAEKDLNALVKNDESIAVGRNRSATVGREDTLTVGTNHVRRLGVNETVTVGAVQTTTVGAAQIVTVGGEQAVTVGADRTLTVAGGETIAVGGSQSITLGGDVTRTVAGGINASTKGPVMETFGGQAVSKHGDHRVVIVAAADQSERSASLHVEGSIQAFANTTIDATALKGITITCGQSQIVLKQDSITISSPTVSFVSKDVEVATAKMAVAGTDAVTVTGSKVTLTSSGATVALDSNATVQGAQVQLGSGSGSSAQNSTKPPKTTTIVLRDPSGKPLANQPVVLRLGGEGGQEKAVVLDDQGQLQVPGDDSFEVSFPNVDNPSQN